MPLEVAGPNVGERAPDFSLNEADGRSVSLSNLEGKKILLIFYRGAW